MSGFSPQVIGLGCDIVEVKRIAAALQRSQNFMAQHFTAEECAYFQQFRHPFPRVAGHFSAKEAIAKALGWGMRAPLNFSSISIQHDEWGKPHAYLLNEAKEKWPHLAWQISISHTEDNAMAVALALSEKPL